MNNMDKYSKYTFSAYKTKSWDDLRATLIKLDRWVFRGHSNYDWALATSLERAAARSGLITRELAEKERAILSKFKKRANSFLTKFRQKRMN